MDAIQFGAVILIIAISVGIKIGIMKLMRDELRKF